MLRAKNRRIVPFIIACTIAISSSAQGGILDPFKRFYWHERVADLPAQQQKGWSLQTLLKNLESDTTPQFKKYDPTRCIEYNFANSAEQKRITDAIKLACKQKGILRWDVHNPSMCTNSNLHYTCALCYLKRTAITSRPFTQILENAQKKTLEKRLPKIIAAAVIATAVAGGIAWYLTRPPIGDCQSCHQEGLGLYKCNKNCECTKPSVCKVCTKGQGNNSCISLYKEKEIVCAVCKETHTCTHLSKIWKCGCKGDDLYICHTCREETVGTPCPFCRTDWPGPPAQHHAPLNILMDNHGGGGNFIPPQFVGMPQGLPPDQAFVLMVMNHPNFVPNPYFVMPVPAHPHP